MNKRITEAFAKGKAFIPFVTCGDPSLEVTEKIVYAMEEAGADLIELGIPFSDPTAEGPVIQSGELYVLYLVGLRLTKYLIWLQKIRKKYINSDGIYDVCECCVFLRCRAFLQERQRKWDMDGTDSYRMGRLRRKRSLHR